jgi:hypothetical protein
MNLEFTYLTSSEKLEIMCCSPDKEKINTLGQYIAKQRRFSDTEKKDIFTKELNSLINARSGGKPKIMKKPKKSN